MAERPLDFDSFARVHPQSHVVVGKVVGNLRGAELTAIHRQLRQRIKFCGIAGDHTSGLVRTADATEIHFRFAALEDAAAFGVCFNAHPTVGSTSQGFVLDDAVRARFKTAVQTTQNPTAHRGKRKDPRPGSDVGNP